MVESYIGVNIEAVEYELCIREDKSECRIETEILSIDRGGGG